MDGERRRRRFDCGSSQERRLIVKEKNHSNEVKGHPFRLPLSFAKDIRRGTFYVRLWEQKRKNDSDLFKNGVGFFFVFLQKNARFLIKKDVAGVSILCTIQEDFLRWKDKVISKFQAKT